MSKLIITASDRAPLFVRCLDTKPSPVPINEETALSAFNYCIALIKKENPTIVILNLSYTTGATHKIELHYALKGRFEISPMGHVEKEYSSLAQCLTHMYADFSGLERPR